MSQTLIQPEANIKILQFIIQYDRQDAHVTAWKIYNTTAKWAIIYHQDQADLLRKKLGVTS